MGYPPLVLKRKRNERKTKTGYNQQMVSGMHLTLNK